MDVLSLLSSAAAETLGGLPFEDRARAERMLVKTAERAGPPHEAVPFVERLLPVLAEAPDPEMALLNLDRWSFGLATPATTFDLLREDPRLLEDLLHLFGASKYLSDILARDPHLYGMLLESAEPRRSEEYAAAVESALRSLRRPESRRDALRRVKRREFLRIGWRDLARHAPLEEVAREISDLADALVRGALRLAEEEVGARFPTARAAVRFAVIGMGKLGARELNYSSDIDLLFLMDSPDPLDEGHRRYATRLAETLIEILARDTGEGRCFRVDMRLRPEGRSGALVRSFAAFREYYDRWVETWERQALIKARPVAGDEELGERFMQLAGPVAFRRFQGATVLEDVREMRAAVEQKLLAAGEMDRHVKEGRGTIRDVEFTVQLLQLLFAAERPELQARDTAGALEALAAAGVLTVDERRTFGEGYRFFRETEHRLQILHDLPVRLLPESPADLRRLARSMGFAESGPFLEEYRRRSNEVRVHAERIHARLGIESGGEGDVLRAAVLTADSPESEPALRAELKRRGFPRVDAAVEAFARLAAGPPGYRHPAATRRLFADLAPALLSAAQAAADPTGALEALAELADRKLLHRSLYQTWSEHPRALESLCRFGGGAPAAMRLVLRFPELSDLVTDEELLLQRMGAEALRMDAVARAQGGTTPDRRMAALRRFKHREFVRLAARRAVAPVAAEEETAEWTDVADAALEAALMMAVDRLHAEGKWPREDAGDFAVLALGRYGGRDLHFASDLDLLYVFGPDEGLTQQQYETLARAFNDAVQKMLPEGRLWEVDLRLRPEGRSGFQVTSLEAARKYYGEEGRAQTWEFQMLTRLRFVTGSRRAGEAFRDLVLPRVYRSPMPPEWTDEIRHMKRRIETERAAEGERERHLKLGPGGLSDIEFLVQYLQLRHGAEQEALRAVSTRDVIRALAASGLLKEHDAETLLDAHAFLTDLRQTATLLRTEGSPDVVPAPDDAGEAAVVLARAMGLESADALHRAYRERAEPVRRLFRRVLEAGS